MIGMTDNKPEMCKDSSIDSGYGDQCGSGDETDGFAQLVDEPVIHKTRDPTIELARRLNSAEIADSMSPTKMMKDEKNAAPKSFVSKMSQSVAKLRNLGSMSCIMHKKKIEDCGRWKVQIQDTTHTSTQNQGINFGMHIQSYKENGVVRHLVSGVEAASLAASFGLQNRDELLMIEDSAVVGINPVIMLSYFWKLSVDKPVSIVTRRDLGFDSCGGHVVYEYFNLKGTIHIYEDEVIHEVKDVMVETSYGVKDLFDIKYIGNDRRSFQNQDNVIMRINEGQIALDMHSHSLFYFDVLKYHALQFRDNRINPIHIWIMRCSDDTNRYYLSKDEADQVTIMKDRKFNDDAEWDAFCEEGIKWVTRSLADNNATHVFQCLSNPDLFMHSRDDHISLRHSDSKSARVDSAFHIQVFPEKGK